MFSFGQLALPAVANSHVVVREWKDDLGLLRKVVPGRADRSYGIQVARLAGLPPAVVARAREILAGLERDELTRGGRPSLSGSSSASSQQQLGLFVAPAAQDDHLRRRLREIDVNHLTPMQALTLIAELKDEAGVIVSTPQLHKAQRSQFPTPDAQNAQRRARDQCKVHLRVIRRFVFGSSLSCLRVWALGVGNRRWALWR